MAKLVSRVSMPANVKESVIMLASNSTKAHSLFGGKTLLDVAREYDLGDEDVTFGYSVNPNTNEEIKSLMVRIDGVKWQIPFSRSVNGGPDKLDDCLMWEFRTGFLSVKENGVPKVDENGAIVLDKMKPYMSFGKPSGITVVREEAAFTPIEENSGVALADSAK